MPNSDFAAARKRGGEATRKKNKAGRFVSSSSQPSQRLDVNYHKPNASDTPSITQHFSSNRGPQTTAKKGKGMFGPKAWCYVHDTTHAWLDCPANEKD